MSSASAKSSKKSAKQEVAEVVAPVVAVAEPKAKAEKVPRKASKPAEVAVVEVVAEVAAPVAEKAPRKSKSKSSADSSVVTTVVPIVEASAVPASEKAPRKSSKAKTAVEVVAPIVVESAPVVAPVAEHATEHAVAEGDVAVASPLSLAVAAAEARFDALMAAIAENITRQRAQLNSLREARANTLKQLREAFKRRGKGERTKRREGSTTGFKIPVLLSPALCKFLGEPEGTLLPRTEVTSRITTYAKSHGLTEGKNLKADEAMRTLLNPPAEMALTYFNLQTLLTTHYPPPKDKKSKAKAKVATASA